MFEFVPFGNNLANLGSKSDRSSKCWKIVNVKMAFVDVVFIVYINTCIIDHCSITNKCRKSADKGSVVIYGVYNSGYCFTLYCYCNTRVCYCFTWHFIYIVQVLLTHTLRVINHSENKWCQYGITQFRQYICFICWAVWSFLANHKVQPKVWHSTRYVIPWE